MEYYSTIKRDKALIRTTTWLQLENIMLHESQTQKAICCLMFDSIYMKCPELAPTWTQKAEERFPGAGGRGKWEVIANG